MARRLRYFKGVDVTNDRSAEPTLFELPLETDNSSGEPPEDRASSAPAPRRVYGSCPVAQGQAALPVAPSMSPGRTYSGGLANRPSKSPGSDIGDSVLPKLL